jgi:hypothetical protein
MSVEYGNKSLHVHDQCDILVGAPGTQSTPVKLNISGLDTSQGPIVHTGAWDPELECKNKRIGVVGNGAIWHTSLRRPPIRCQVHNALYPKPNLNLHELNGSIHTRWRQLPQRRGKEAFNDFARLFEHRTKLERISNGIFKKLVLDETCPDVKKAFRTNAETHARVAAQW